MSYRKKRMEITFVTKKDQTSFVLKMNKHEK